MKASHHSKPPIKIKTRPDLVNLADTERRIKFQKSISEAPTKATAPPNIEKWETLKSIINTSALDSLGKLCHKQPDWFIHSAQTLLPAIAAKCSTRLAYLNSNSPSSKAAYLSAKGDVQHMHMTCSLLSEHIIRFCDTGKLHGMYIGIKEALGPTPKKTAPLRALDGSLLTEVQAQL